MKTASLLIVLMLLMGCITKSDEPEQAEAKRNECAADLRCWRYDQSTFSDLLVTRCGQHIQKAEVVNCNEVRE